MTKTLLLIAVILCNAATFGIAQSRVVTLTVNNHAAYGPSILTNELSIGMNESVDIVSKLDLSGGRARLDLKKGELQFENILGFYPSPIKIAGPARLTLRAGCGFGECGPALVTLSVAPESFPPDKTVIVPAGTSANIVLESSTNLIQWTATSPGVYTNKTDNTFFRIRAERTLLPSIP